MALVQLFRNRCEQQVPINLKLPLRTRWHLYMTKFSAAPYRQNFVIRPLSDRQRTVKSGIFSRRDHDEKLVHDFVDLAWAETAALRADPH